MSKAVFILGMHRSGTSALARVVNLLGADLGNRLMPAAQDNEKGFFEHEDIVVAHEALLTALGVSWQDGTPLPSGWENSEAAAVATQRINEILDRDFANSPLWAVKDPRQSRLLPLWLPLLKARGIEPYFILSWRHPLQVAASLQKRDGMARDAALLCWLSYTVEAYLGAKGYPLVISSYAALMENWQAEMSRIGEGLNLSWPVSPEDAKPAVEAFLTPQLQHNRQQGSEETLPPAVQHCLNLLESPDEQGFAALHQQWQQENQATASLLQQARLQATALEESLQNSRKSAAAAEHRSNDLQHQMQQLQALLEQERHNAQQRETVLQVALEQVYASASWKVTEPLRRLSAICGRERNELEKTKKTG